jgi:hypothetical protein
LIHTQGSNLQPIDYEPIALPLSKYVSFFGWGTKWKNTLAINRFRADNQISARTAIDDVGLKAILADIQMIRQPFFHDCIIHPRRNTELRRLQIERTTFKPNMNHRNTSCDRTKKLNVELVQVCKAVFGFLTGSM